VLILDGGLRLVLIGMLVVTAYCACEECCGSYADGYTASGTEVEEGRTVAAGPELPFGAVLHITGLGLRVVEDRGGAIGNGRIDLFIDCHQRALRFGRQRLRVWVVREGGTDERAGL